MLRARLSPTPSYGMIVEPSPALGARLLVAQSSIFSTVALTLPGHAVVLEALRGFQNSSRAFSFSIAREET